MPGFGYSDGPPLDVVGVAGLWAELMTALGYERFGAAGGDIGSGVSRFLALDHPDRVVAVHRTDGGIPIYTGDPADLAPEEREFIAGAQAWGAGEGAYAAMHRTKPLTAAVGLTDSPAGLAAWIVEKLHAWSDVATSRRSRRTRSSPTSRSTGSPGPSARRCGCTSANAAVPPAQHARRVEVPSGFSIFPHDLVRPPRAWLDRTANTVRVTEPARGGHFAPFEEPELYAQELRDFFRDPSAATDDPFPDKRDIPPPAARRRVEP